MFQQRKRAFVQAFFHVSLPIAKAKMPHTITEELIMSCVKDINCILSGKETESKLNIPSFSDNAVQHGISLMSKHIKDQVIDEVKSAGPFALQLDESTDVSFCAQLYSIRAHIYDGEFLCIINLPSRTREEDIYQIIDIYFKTNVMRWKPMRGLCTGVASAMLCHSSGVYT